MRAALPPANPRQSAEDDGVEPDSLGNLQIERGTRIRDQPSLTHERARLQARIIAPVLARTQNAAEAAAEWRDEFRKAGGGEISGALAEFPKELRGAYPDLDPSTVYRWVKKVRNARDAARRAGDPPPTDAEALIHRKPSRWIEKRLKRTPALCAQVVECLIEDRDQTHEDIALQIGDVARRTITRVINEDLAPALVATLLGGGRAEEEVLLLRLPRPPREFNDIWQLDDGVVNTEIVEPEFVDALRNTDIDFHCLQRIPQEGGVWRMKRVERIYVQVIVDAYSRMKLVHRVFPYPPRGVDTLVTIAIAAFRYGMPKVLYTDNGSNFKSGTLRTLLDEAGIRQVFSRPAEPRSRGIVENWIGLLKRRFGAEVVRHRRGRDPAALGVHYNGPT